MVIGSRCMQVHLRAKHSTFRPQQLYTPWQSAPCAIQNVRSDTFVVHPKSLPSSHGHSWFRFQSSFSSQGPAS